MIEAHGRIGPEAFVQGSLWCLWSDRLLSTVSENSWSNIYTQKFFEVQDARD